MGHFVIHELSPSVRVQVTREIPALDDGLDRQVESLWQAACSRVARGGAGRLFNGRIFCADRITPRLIEGHLTEYRRAIAQVDQPALFSRLRQRPLAVCGVLRCTGGVVFGRRHRDAVYQPGMWQLPPAGSVDAGSVGAEGSVDLSTQLLAELTEELGLPPDTATPVGPLCIVEHPGSHVCDLGMALHSSLSGEEVLAAHARRGNREYEPVTVIPLAAIPAFVQDAGSSLVPPARIFLERTGFLPPNSASPRS
jgi:hypothetical protein